MKCFNPPVHQDRIVYLVNCPDCNKQVELPIRNAINIVPHCRLGAVITFICPECGFIFDNHDIGVDTDNEQIQAICSDLRG